MPVSAQRVFVSYSHEQQDWVLDRLVPCLKAGHVDVLIDRDRFKAGLPVVGQMDALQDQADVNLLIFSPAYLASPFCTHEMQRAIDRDPTFTRGTVIPVRRVDCGLPAAITAPNPLWVDLRNERNTAAWQQLLDACRAELGTDPLDWLDCRDEVRQLLDRGSSVHLLVTGETHAWRGLVDNVAQRPSLPLTRVDLQDPRTIARPGILNCMLDVDGAVGSSPTPSCDLVEFQRAILDRPTVSRVALLHFDMVLHRKYGADFFSTLCHLVSQTRKLVLLIHSRTPLLNLLQPEWRTIISQAMPTVVSCEAGHEAPGAGGAWLRLAQPPFGTLVAGSSLLPNRPVSRLSEAAFVHPRACHRRHPILPCHSLDVAVLLRWTRGGA